jgi:SAM-dependent methyltransferase
MASTGNPAETRFEFGENWQRFLDLVNDERIDAAKRSLVEYLEVENLIGKSFLDVGSGSGLFSLAARLLGAEVVSFDYDAQSVACTRELRRRYRADDTGWRVMQGSVLDADFVSSLGQFDVVYSWGVLHHTGDMAGAFEAVAPLVAPDGRLFVSIYNDQGRPSRLWARVKRAYNEAGPYQRKLILAGAQGYFGLQDLKDTAVLALRRVPREPEGRTRGMDKERDLVDWVGGYPFEVAMPEEVFDFFHGRGFTLDRLKTCGGGLGCNEFVFTREPLSR